MGVSGLKREVEVDFNRAMRWQDELDQLMSAGIYGDVYFESAYSSLYANENCLPEYFIYKEKDKSFFFPYIKRSIPTGLIDQGFFDIESVYGYGGPLVTNQDRGFLKKAWKEFMIYCNERNIIAGFVRFHPLLKNHLIGQGMNNVKVDFSNQVVTLTLAQKKEVVFKNYSKNRRNKIRKSIKNGVSIISGEEENFLRIFQGLYMQTMNQVGAVDFFYFDENYFSQIRKDLKGKYKIYLAKKDMEYIGGVLLLYSSNFVHFHLSANLENYRFLEPASLLRHCIIEDHLQGKQKVMLFGGGGGENESLFKFKSDFSKEREDFYIGKILINSDIYDSVCRQWEVQNPQKNEKYKNYFLKYQF